MRHLHALASRPGRHASGICRATDHRLVSAAACRAPFRHSPCCRKSPRRRRHASPHATAPSPACRYRPSRPTSPTTTGYPPIRAESADRTAAVAARTNTAPRLGDAIPRLNHHAPSPPPRTTAPLNPSRPARGTISACAAVPGHHGVVSAHTPPAARRRALRCCTPLRRRRLRRPRPATPRSRHARPATAVAPASPHLPCSRTTTARSGRSADRPPLASWRAGADPVVAARSALRHTAAAAFPKLRAAWVGASPPPSQRPHVFRRRAPTAARPERGGVWRRC